MELPPYPENHEAKLVAAATSEALLIPDWGANFEIADRANGHAERAKEIARAVANRIHAPNQKVVFLAVTLLDALFKNGNDAVQAALAAPAVSSALRNLCIGNGGPEAQAKAAALVQELGIAWAAAPNLPWASLLGQLRSSGAAAFPPTPDPAAVASMFTSLSVGRGSGSAAHAAHHSRAHGDGASGGGTTGARGPAPPPASAADIAAAVPRLWRELRRVREQVAVIARLVLSGAAGADKPDFVDALEFLQQCMDRMRDLVEAGVNGVIDESLFEETLAVNDAVARVLEVGLPMSTAAPGSRVPSAAADSLSDLTGFGAQGGQPPPQAEPLQRAGAVAGAGANDDLLGLFAPSTSTPAPAAGLSVSAAPNGAAAAAYNPFDHHVPAAPAATPAPRPAPMSSSAASVFSDFDAILQPAGKPG